MVLFTLSFGEGSSRNKSVKRFLIFLGIAIAVAGCIVAWRLCTRPAAVQDDSTPARKGVYGTGNAVVKKSVDGTNSRPDGVKAEITNRLEWLSRVRIRDVKDPRERMRMIEERNKAFAEERAKRKAEREKSPEIKARNAQEEQQKLRREALKMRDAYEGAMDEEMRERYRRRPIDYWIRRAEQRKRHREEFEKRHGIERKDPEKPENPEDLSKDGQKQKRNRKHKKE